MKKSESIKELAAALSKAQGAFDHAKKDVINAFFKSKYADLANCIDAAKKPLLENGLSVTQIIDVSESGGMVLETMLMHISGEWISGSYPIAPLKGDPQAYGSCIQYARRYAFSAITGIAADDDDGNDASVNTYSSKPSLVAPTKTVDYLAALKATKTLADLSSCWQMIPAELRKTYEHTKNEQKAALTPPKQLNETSTTENTKELNNG
jgi:hypothetical protein